MKNQYLFSGTAHGWPSHVNPCLLRKSVYRTKRRPLPVILLLALFLVQGGNVCAQTSPATFNFTGNVQSFTVPAGVTSLTVVAKGAQGEVDNPTNGKGGSVTATMSVTPGEILLLYVGGRGSELLGGFNGGGTSPNVNGGFAGGGATDIRMGGAALANRVIVAGGGGGDGSTPTGAGGAGGGTTGGDGSGDASGKGGDTSAGGTAGGFSATAGQLGIGGAGDGDDGVGGSGGGGYYGGGGGFSSFDADGGGGGGSSYTDDGRCTNVTHAQGDHEGDGEITLSWGASTSLEDPCTSLTVAISPASQTISSGGNVTLTASGAGAYTWSNGGSGNTLIISNVTSTTAFSVTGTTGGCSATATAAVSVTSSTLSTISSGSCVTLTSACDNFGGTYKLSSIQYEGRVSYSDEDGNFLYYYAFDSNVPDHPEGWYVSDPGNLGVYYHPATTATPPLTGWQPYTYDQYTCSDQITLADLACPVDKACLTVTTDCVNGSGGSFGGTYEETGTDGGRPSLTDEDGNIISYYLAGGDSMYPTGWYLTDPDEFTAYYNPSTSDTPPTSGWTAFTDDGYGCSGSITVTTCSTGCTAPTVTIIGNQLISCNQSLTLTASGDAAGVAFDFIWSANAEGATTGSVVVKPVLSNTAYSVTVTNPDTGCSGVASVTATLAPTIAVATPPTVIGVLGAGNCPINITAMGTGNSFIFTGPDGYVFSTVYRKPNNYTVKANGIKSPGTYTMSASYTDACGQTSTTSQTFVVTGTGCN